jgi:hypothetical protein
MRRLACLPLLLAVIVVAPGCSLESYAIKNGRERVSSDDSVYETDDDLELGGGAAVRARADREHPAAAGVLSPVTSPYRSCRAMQERLRWPLTCPLLPGEAND